MRVVDTEPGGKILGAADDVVLDNPNDVITSTDSLLPVSWSDTGQKVWNLEIEPDTGPKLYISDKLREHQEHIGGDAMFTGCVLPEVFRRILEYEVLSEDYDPEDDDTWFYEWRRWMGAVPELKEIANGLTDASDAVDRGPIIEELVSEFAAIRRNSFADNLVRSLADGRR